LRQFLKDGRRVAIELILYAAEVGADDGFPDAGSSANLPTPPNNR